MPREKATQPTRQLYAQIREDIYLASKARAAEMRVPLREFIEDALESALKWRRLRLCRVRLRSFVWDDEYLGMQLRQPLGSPVELTSEEAKVHCSRSSFGVGRERKELAEE